MKQKILRIFIICIPLIVLSVILRERILPSNPVNYSEISEYENYISSEEKYENNPIEPENSDKTSNTSNLKNKVIYNIHSENSWILDPAKQENLLKGNNFFIKIKVISSEKSLYLSENRMLGSVTPYRVEILDDNNLNGLTGKQVIYVSGGEVPLKEFMNRSDKDTISKLGLDTLSLEELDKLYISYTTDYDYDLIVGEEYIVIVGYSDTENAYFIPCQGYGIFKKDGVGYRNVITDILFEF